MARANIPVRIDIRPTLWRVANAYYAPQLNRGAQDSVFDENPAFDGPPAAGLGNSDPAHVSEHGAFSQAAGIGSRRAVALAPPQPFDAGASQTKGM
jgi:hypothetical protein